MSKESDIEGGEKNSETSEVAGTFEVNDFIRPNVELKGWATAPVNLDNDAMIPGFHGDVDRLHGADSVDFFAVNEDSISSKSVRKPRDSSHLQDRVTARNGSERPWRSERISLSLVALR